MEESNEAFEASSDSPVGITTPSANLAELTSGYQLLEARATIPEKGLPFTENPADVLSELFSSKKAGFVLDELWARLCVVVTTEPNEDQELIERALIISEPADGDARTPRTRCWIRSDNSYATEPASEPVMDTVVCLVPNIVSSGDDDGDLSFEPDETEANHEDDEGAEEDSSDTKKAPTYIVLFRNALLPALTLLTGIARAHENYVHDPINVLRETLRRHGIEEHLDMAFVNWLVRCDYIYVAVPGPKIIWVRDDTYTLLGLHEKIVKPVDADAGRPFLLRKEFSRDLTAAAIVAFIDIADDHGIVLNPIDHLEKVLEAFGEDPSRAVGLLQKLARERYVRGVGHTSTRLQPAALDFAETWRKATELTFEALDAPTGDVPEDLPPEPEAPLPPPIAEVVEQEIPALDEPPFVSETSVPAEIETALSPPISIELTEEALAILEAYLAAHPEQEASELLSALVIEHLGREIRLLESALEQSYALLRERSSRTRDHQGKPVVFTPASLLCCYPPHLSKEEAEAQLFCMAERSWIRWVHPYRRRGVQRRPPPYIVLMR